MDDKKLEKAYWLTIENASSLIKEATVLKNVAMFPRAYSLFQLAIEECGKSSIIYDAIIQFYNGAKIDLKYLKEKGFEDHSGKIEKSLRIELAGIMMYEESQNKNTGLVTEILANFKKINETNTLKNQSLYVHYNRNKFISPVEIITEKMIKDIEYSANVRLQIACQMFGTLEELKDISNKLHEIINNPEKLKAWEQKALKRYT